MKKLFRLYHSRGHGFIQFNDYSPVLLTAKNNPSWRVTIVTINEHSLIQSEEEVPEYNLNSDYLWSVQRTK